MEEVERAERREEGLEAARGLLLLALELLLDVVDALLRVLEERVDVLEVRLLVRRRPAERELEVLEDRRRGDGRVRLDAEVLERRGQLVDGRAEEAVDEPRDAEALYGRARVAG